MWLNHNPQTTNASKIMIVKKLISVTLSCIITKWHFQLLEHSQKLTCQNSASKQGSMTQSSYIWDWWIKKTNLHHAQVIPGHLPDHWSLIGWHLCQKHASPAGFVDKRMTQKARPNQSDNLCHHFMAIRWSLPQKLCWIDHSLSRV